MENPRRWFARSVAIAVGCGGTAVVLLATSSSKDSWQMGVSVFLICFAGYAIVAMVLNLWSMRKLARIRRGVDVSARWVVPQKDWERFVAAERNGTSNGTLAPNLVDLNMHVPAEGIEVVIAGHAVAIGPELHRLRGYSVRACSGPHYVNSDPPTMQYQLTLVAGEDIYYDSTIRFPAGRFTG